MALGAVLGAALSDFTLVRTKLLTIDGFDVTLKPRSTGNGYGTLIETVIVNAKAPGQVGSMSFTYEDPLNTIAISDGSEVYFHDIVTDTPIFLGYVSTFTKHPAADGVGSVVDVEVDHVDIVQDWAILPADLSIPAGTWPNVAAQQVASSVVGIPFPLRYGSAATGAPGPSTQALPVANFYIGGFQLTMTYPLTLLAGTSMRECLRLIGVSTATSGTLFMIDETRGLRFYLGGTGSLPTDWTTLTVVDTVGSTLNAADLGHTTDAASIVRGIYIKGGNAAGTGLLMDGTGKAGRIAYLEDATILDAAWLNATQRAYLTAAGVFIRGSFDLQDFTPAAGVHAGSNVDITDTSVGLAGGAFATWQLSEMGRRFHGSGRETWHVSYGRPAPSFSSELRRATADFRA